jgi:hypothetical protein
MEGTKKRREFSGALPPWNLPWSCAVILLGKITQSSHRWQK